MGQREDGNRESAHAFGTHPQLRVLPLKLPSSFTACSIALWDMLCVPECCWRSYKEMGSQWGSPSGGDILKRLISSGASLQLGAKGLRSSLFGYPLTLSQRRHVLGCWSHVTPLLYGTHKWGVYLPGFRKSQPGFGERADMLVRSHQLDGLVWVVAYEPANVGWLLV